MSEKECILDIPVEHLENIFGQFEANIKLIDRHFRLPLSHATTA